MIASERDRIEDLVSRMETMLSDPYLKLTSSQCAAVKNELRRLADARFPEEGKEEASTRVEDPDLEAVIDDLVELGADSFWSTIRRRVGPPMPNMETAVREWWSCNKFPKKGGV